MGGAASPAVEPDLSGIVEVAQQKGDHRREQHSEKAENPKSEEHRGEGRGGMQAELFSHYAGLDDIAHHGHYAVKDQQACRRGSDGWRAGKQSPKGRGKRPNQPAEACRTGR